jgi:hypothetical protein
VITIGLRLSQNSVSFGKASIFWVKKAGMSGFGQTCPLKKGGGAYYERELYHPSPKQADTRDFGKTIHYV